MGGCQGASVPKFLYLGVTSHPGGSVPSLTSLLDLGRGHWRMGGMGAATGLGGGRQRMDASSRAPKSTRGSCPRVLPGGPVVKTPTSHTTQLKTQLSQINL